MLGTSKAYFLCSAVAILAWACTETPDDPQSSSDANTEGGGGGGGGMPPSAGGGNPDVGVGGGGAGGGDSAPALLAPTLDAVNLMMGGLHVLWTNNQTDCDTIEGERKKPSTEYEVVFTLPGEADNKHDASATQDVEYTYRVRCLKGEAYSAYSNELSQNPTE